MRKPKSLEEKVLPDGRVEFTLKVGATVLFCRTMPGAEADFYRARLREAHFKSGVRSR